MNKKKILFIISNMESGGVSKSMSSLLNVIDTNRYDVSVFITNPTGVFMELIPNTIKVIEDKKTQYIFSVFPENLKLLLKNGYFFSFFMRILVAFLMKINRGMAGWILSRMIFRIQEEFDLAVDFNGQHQLYYLVDFVKAKKKVSFFHSDYTQWDYYYAMDKRYYPKMDKIFTISPTCVASLQKYFPQVQDKIELFENISSPQLINSLSEAFSVELAENSIVTIGHLSKKKGTPLALEVARILKIEGFVFKWYFIGENSQDQDYQAIIKQYGIENEIVLLGLKVNPYPYVKATKVIAHLSEFEGRSIALDEAKILEKPIVVTSFSTVLDQFQPNITATICNFDAQEIAKAIKELLLNQEVRNRYSSNLRLHNVDTTNEIQKIYHLLA